ncbi:MAG TPA: cellulase family glycosylhydrolase [Verrucomicrobiae bacterium]|nr:cellulase family glycosylhydrolase [Verrucomicrobiae bacterium]
MTLAHPPGSLLLALVLSACGGDDQSRQTKQAIERISLSPDGRGFVTAQSQRPFYPWGMNYGNAGRLMEDFWDADWNTFADDFREMRAIGANVVRVHLQFGKFMRAADEPDTPALNQLARTLKLAEDTGLYLDITGLASYRPADAPTWYDTMDEGARWTTQANFWAAVAKTCARSPAVFCYDLMNEPISPAGRREPGKWRSGNLLGNYDFVQFIALDPADRPREGIAVAWIRQMTAAIRRHDPDHLITVGSLPWSRKWKFLSGFLPEKIAPELDFLSVHIYPEKDLPEEAMECLRKFSVGKPVVIEETFPLSCGTGQLKAFLLASRQIACGWIGHYDGDPPEQLDALKRQGQITMTQAFYREWQRLFVELKPTLAP